MMQRNGEMIMEKNRTVELIFILDESGSMQSFRQDTVGGFNSTIEEHKGKDENIITSVILFNTGRKVLYDRIPIDEVPVMTPADYRPNSGTALCDAVGETINNILCRQLADPNEKRPSKTLVFITTDGMENASRVFSANAVRELITSTQDNCDWEFVFYGSNFDAVSTAATYGIRKENAMEYQSSHDGYQRMHASRNIKLKEFLN